MRVFWAVLLERTITDTAANTLLEVSAVAAIRGYNRILAPYGRVDMARNFIVSGFMEHTKDPDDLLVMLDCDHEHPRTIVWDLAQHDPELGVVGALAHRRSEPHDPCFFLRTDEGLTNLREWQEGAIYECAIVGTGAVAIRRWVFEKLVESGEVVPPYWFTYDYQGGLNPPSEDVVFALKCERAGIPHYCNTGIMTPHIGQQLIGTKEFRAWMKANPKKHNGTATGQPYALEHYRDLVKET